MKETFNTKPETIVHIVGDNMMQNKLLLLFIEKETGLKGSYTQILKEVTSTDTKQLQFFIIDSHDIDFENLWDKIKLWKNSNLSKSLFTLCNVEPEEKIEKIAIINGIKGIFYTGDSPRTISKAIPSILKGDLWYSRKILVRCLLERNPFDNDLKAYTMSYLSLRELEVIKLIALGFNNRSIANDLCISVNTVKTHTYNIYKKINVSNRFQACLWTSKYCQES